MVEKQEMITVSYTAPQSVITMLEEIAVMYGGMAKSAAFRYCVQKTYENIETKQAS